MRSAVTASLPFVGRDREVKLLRNALDSALSGKGGVALISGEAGIGKTTLAEMACDEARKRRALALTGRCYDLTETAPFAPWIDLFNAYPTDPSLPKIPNNLARFEADDNTTSQAALFARAHRFLTEVATERPVVLLLDDQHWADDASLDLLRYIARQTARLPLFIIATYRPDELSTAPHLGQLLPLLAREARPLRLHLKPLSSDDLWAIIRSRYPLGTDDEARLTSYVQLRAEGNPFYTGELLQTLEDDGVLQRMGPEWALGDLGQASTPLLIEQIVGGKLARLSDQDQRLLAIASVLGQELTLSLWGKVAKIDQQSLLEVLDRASEAHLMSESPNGQGARFVHALVRQVIYNQISPSRRRDWHQRTGTELAAMPAPDPDSVASHLRRAGDPSAVEWLICAGFRADRAYSWRTANQRFEAAYAMLQLSGEDPERQGWLLIRSARMLRYSAPEIGLERLSEARRISRRTSNRYLAAVALMQTGLLHCLDGKMQRGIEVLERGVAAYDALDPSEVARTVAAEPALSIAPDRHGGRGTLAMWLTVVGRFAAAVKCATPYELDDITTVDYGNSYGDALASLGRARAILGYNDASGTVFARAHDAYRQDDHHAQLARSLMIELQMRVLTYSPENLVLRQQIEAEAEAAWQRGSGALADESAGAMLMPLQSIEGRWSELKRTALALRAHDTSGVRTEATLLLGPVAYAQGDTELVAELIAECLPAGSATAPGNVAYRTAVRMQQLGAGLALDAGDLPTAKRWLEATDHWLAWSGAVVGQAECALGWAAYHQAHDDLGQALKHAQIALQHASAPRQPLAIARAHLTLGELNTGHGRYDVAAQHLEAAMELADACVVPFDRALILLAQAELDHVQACSSRTAPLLATAQSILTSLGARPALARAQRLIARLEDRPGDRELPPVVASASERDTQLLGELTPRERDVLRLLPAGHTNQEIADLLYLSPKTVENHVGRILAKTGLPNRAAAAALAQRAGIA